MRTFFRALAFMAAVALTAVLLLPASAAQGQVYVGGDFVYDGINYSGGIAAIAPSALYGVNAYVGYDLFDNVAIEGGYFGVWGANGTSVGVQGLTGDGVLRVPLIGYLSLLGTAGVTWLNTSGASGLLASHEWGLRGGAGFEVGLADGIAWRTLARYQQAGFHNAASGSIVLSSGFTVRF